MKPCVCCLSMTDERCLECGDAYCSEHETILCPMCARIKQFKWQQAQMRRVVYWQYVEVPLHIRTVAGQVDLGAVTQPMETIQVECW